jgi:hypothetical protein
MTIFHVLRVSPFLGLALCVCLVTIGWCFLVLRNGLHHTVDRFMIGFIGLLSVYQGTQILKSVGLLQLSDSRALDNAVELVVTALYLAAGVLLKSSSRHRFAIMFQLRLAEAQPECVQIADASRQNDQLIGLETQIDMLRSAGMLLSDNAFKVYTYIWLNADRTTGLLNGSEHDFMRLLSKSRRALLSAQDELIRTGVCKVRFSDPGRIVDFNHDADLRSRTEQLVIWRNAQTISSACLKLGRSAASMRPGRLMRAPK